MTKHRDSSLDDEQDSVEMLQAEIEEDRMRVNPGYQSTPAKPKSCSRSRT